MNQSTYRPVVIHNLVSVVHAAYTGGAQESDVLMFAHALQLRKMIVKDRFYRQSREIKLEMLQSFATLVTDYYRPAVVSIDDYPLPTVSVNTTRIFDALITLRGVEWANAVYALASPSLYVKNILRYYSNVIPEETYVPFIGPVPTVDTLSKALYMWDVAMQGCVVACPADTVYEAIASVVHGNIKMSEMYNAFAPEPLTLVVYDEDVVPVEQPEEDVAQPSGGPVGHIEKGTDIEDEKGTDIEDEKGTDIEDEKGTDIEDEKGSFNQNHQDNLG